MFINTIQPLYNLDGSVIKKADKDVLLGEIICEALIAALPSDKLSGEEKLKRFLLATRLSVKDLSISVTIEEAALLKKIINEVYPSPLIVGQVWALLETNEVQYKNGTEKEVINAKLDS